MKSKAKRLGVAMVLSIATLTLLTGCGPGPCEKAGGELVFTHYNYQPMVMPNGSGGTTITMQPIPQYVCVRWKESDE